MMTDTTYNKIHLVVNPASGIGSSLKLLESIKNCLDNKKFEVTTDITTTKYDFVKIVNEKDWKDTLLVLLGGDGSFNQVITEIIKNNIPIKLVPVPAGTSNVYNNLVKVNKKDIAQKINSQKLEPKQYKVAEVEYNKGKLAYFFSMCGVGFDAHIVEKLSRMRKKKLYIWSYFTTSVEELFLKRFQATPFRIFTDTKVWQRVFFALFFNTIAYGGPFTFSRERTYSDDFLYLLNFDNSGISTTPSIYAKAFKSYLYSLVNHPKQIKTTPKYCDFHFLEFTEAIVDTTSDDKIYVHIDGDPLTTLPVVIRKSLKSITVYS